MYGAVEYKLGLAIPNACADGSAVTESTPGPQLESIPSLILRQLVATWTARNPPLLNGVLRMLCEEAVKAVNHCVSNFDVLNKHARMDNVRVREPFVASSSSGGQGEDPAVAEDAVHSA